MGIINMIGKLIATLAVGLASARTIIRRRIIRRVAATTHAKKGGIDYYYHGARVRYNKSTMKFKQDKKASIFHTIKGTKRVATRVPRRTRYLVKGWKYVMVKKRVPNNHFAYKTTYVTGTKVVPTVRKVPKVTYKRERLLSKVSGGK